MAVNLKLAHAGTAKVGDSIGVEWRADASPMETMAAAQVLLEYDRSVLRFARTNVIGAVPSMRLWLPMAGFYRAFNGATVPSASSPFLAVLFAMMGKENAIKVQPAGVLLGTFVFDCISAGTADLKIVPSLRAGGVTQHTVTYSGVSAGLPTTGTMTGTKVVVS